MASKLVYREGDYPTIPEDEVRPPQFEIPSTPPRYPDANWKGIIHDYFTNTGLSTGQVAQKYGVWPNEIPNMVRVVGLTPYPRRSQQTIALEQSWSWVDTLLKDGWNVEEIADVFQTTDVTVKRSLKLKGYEWQVDEESPLSNSGQWVQAE